MQLKQNKVVGITMDLDEGLQYHRYDIRKNYADAIASVGCTPIMIPYCKSSVDHYIDMIDGLILTGGFFDINPSLYNQEIKSETVDIKSSRTEFEWELCKMALHRKLPILGICAGQQLLNVILGGSLIQHIPDEIENCIAHEQTNPKSETSHAVNVIEGTMLHKIVRCLRFDVNSTHHQAVKDVADGVIINARADDSVIEGIELSDNNSFCLGVEWHPEYLSTPQDKMIFQAFADHLGGSGIV